MQTDQAARMQIEVAVIVDIAAQPVVAVRPVVATQPALVSHYRSLYRISHCR